MYERLSGRQPTRGVSAAALGNWGIIFLVVGIAGRGILCNAILGVDSITNAELLSAMQTDTTVMAIATAALVFQAIETCAAPLFAFLLVEGFLHTSNFEKYLTRVGILALVSELPYNFAMSGSVFDLSSRNPVFALFLCLVMLYFFRKYEGKSVKNIAVKVLILVAAFLWCQMLHIDQGNCLVIMVGFLWLVRKKGNMRAIFGFCSSMVCSMFNMLYIASAMSFIFLHMYNGEKGDQNRAFRYAVYPVILLVIGIAAKLF